MNNAIKSWLKVPALGLFLLAAAPSAWATVYVKIQPPDVRIETHEDRKGFVWQSGYWNWRGEKHEWTAGRYEREKPGHRWTDGRWEHHETKGYFWTAGRWDPEQPNKH